ncbi:hypothetical protein [Thermoproteus tenax]|uniref:hypothetical protein n=1 Tax=Thermoproteus tenax TaxID=2271 RepID=UPI00069B61E1|nr:hypothetical protein [Thermoproteus tenax]
MDFWLIRLRGREMSTPGFPKLAGTLRCAGCGAEIKPEEAAYIRISGGRVIAYCRKCVEGLEILR